MGIKASLSKPLAAIIAAKNAAWKNHAIQTQNRIFKELVAEGQKTLFGKDHQFKDINTPAEFKQAVAFQDYEGLKPYIEKIQKGEKDILWTGKPLYLSKTSGTTSGVKYIPITKASIPFHISAARDALLMYIHETGKSSFVDGNMIFLSGSPKLNTDGPVPTGRLSGIVNHYVPSYLRTNQLPSYNTNCIEDWEEKLDAIVNETSAKDMRLISGIPPWVQMYFDKLSAKTGKPIKDIFPHFSLFVYGGVNYEPYRQRIENSIGKKIDSIELYPASEGFIAYQDTRDEEGLLLLTNAGMYYEFIPVNEYYQENPSRLQLSEVKIGINYALILSTNAGLWGYSIGDTIRFVSLQPYRIVVTGRIKQFLSAFGEHVIVEEVEKALRSASENEKIEIIEFTVAPQVTPASGLPYHEWLIEFAQIPENMNAFAKKLDDALRKQNIYYNDLVGGNVIQNLKITCLKKDAFIYYMKSQGKLGGQNKVPRLSNDRKIADELSKYTF